MKGCNQEFKATCKLMPKTQHSGPLRHFPQAFAKRDSILKRITSYTDCDTAEHFTPELPQICGISAGTRSKMTSEVGAIYMIPVFLSRF